MGVGTEWGQEWGQAYFIIYKPKMGSKWGQAYFIIYKPGKTLSNPRRGYNYGALELEHVRIHAVRQGLSR